jgi:hypothetical protein
MVRALLAGKKTQTRRALKPQPAAPLRGIYAPGLSAVFGNPDHPTEDDLSIRLFSLKDRLWVRETWRADQEWDDCAPRVLSKIDAVHYEADGDQRKSNWGDPFAPGKTRVSIHMPRWASRITLTVTDVRVERLQNISKEDALAEGVHPDLCPDEPRKVFAESMPAHLFGMLWESINGVGSWDQNPWVAAYTFTVEQRNIDAPEVRV